MTILKALHLAMQDAEAKAVHALNDGNMERHMTWGRRYHELAEAICALGEADPRPTS